MTARLYSTIIALALVLSLAACAPEQDQARRPTDTAIPAWLYATAIPATASPADRPLEVDLVLAQTRVVELAVAGTATKAAQTATKQTYNDGETATWAAVAKTNNASDHTATAQAVANLATAERGDTQIAQLKTETAIAAAGVSTAAAAAQADADRERRIEADLQRPWQVLAGLGLLGLGVLTYLLYKAWLAHQRETARLQAREARVIHNTLILPSLKGQPELKHLLNGATSGPLLEPDEFDDLPVTPATQQTVTYNCNGRSVQWQKDEEGNFYAPEQEAQRKKVLRFLSKAMRVVGQSSNRVPTRDEMGMHPETWGEPVALLKPYVCTTVGRNGGTYCTADYPTLRELYLAVGERQIHLGTVSGAGDIPAWPKKTSAESKPVVFPTLN